MHQHWQQLEAWMTREFPDLFTSLNPGIPTEQWHAFEAEIGTPLPDSFKAFYAGHNGQEKANPTGFFFGLHFFAL